VLTLYQMTKTGIERHLKIKGEANPYDPSYTEYFEKRRCFVWRTRWTGGKPKTATAKPVMKTSKKP